MMRHGDIKQGQRILLLRRRLISYLLVLRYLQFISYNRHEGEPETNNDGRVNVKEVENSRGDKVKQPYTYTAREWDKEIKLYFNRVRYRDPYSGIFITKDPILKTE